MKIKKIFLLKLLIPIIALIIFSIPEYSIGSDRPFNNSSNWGGTGLMEIPNARILEDGVVRFEATLASPYRWYSGGMGILPGLEFSARVTEITNIPGFDNNKDYGAYKDKAFDAKYQLIPESKALPAIAIGINDFHGTRLFPSEYLVMSRQIYPLDITLGVGSKRLNGDSIHFFSDKYSLFGGFEFELNNRFMFMAEYNPIKYENDFKKGVPEGAKSPVNVGLRVRLLNGVNMGVSFQRADVFGISLNVTSLLGEQVLPQAPDPAPLLPVDRRSFTERESKEIIQGVYDAVKKAGFEGIAVYTDGDNVICEFKNNKYLSNQKAVDRVLRLLLFYSPEDTELLTAVVKNDKFPILKVSVKPDHMDKFILGDISDETFTAKLLKVEIANEILKEGDGNYLSISDDNGYNFEYGIKPDLDIYWNDPSGFLKFAVGVSPYLGMDLWKGASAYARFSVPLYSNITSPSTEELPLDVVRSDTAKYKKDNYTFDRLQIDQILRLSDRLFSRFSIGYFETMYAGIGGESLYFVGDGKLAFGFEGDWVKKRVPKKLFELMDVDRYTLLGSAYYYYSGLDITFKTQYGRFLAGDVGWKFDVSRRYKTGAVLGMFLTYTDTDNIDQPSFNDGYHHKGVYLKLPVRMFYAKDSTQFLNYNISPWTRDIGQTVSHLKDLYNIAGELMPAKFKAESDEIKN